MISSFYTLYLNKKFLSATPVLERLRQEDLKFKAVLGSIRNPCLKK
jgi:hypothetical protein